MKHFFAFLLFLLVCPMVIAQQEAWVYFDSKPNTEFYIDNPQLMLSQRAIDRRAGQQIPIDFKDVPLSDTFVNAVEALPGITVKARSKWLNAVHVRGTLENIQNIENLPFVAQVQIAGFGLAPSPQSRRAAKFEALSDFNYGNAQNQIQMLNGHLMHNAGFTGEGKIIAVMDAGFPGVNTAPAFAHLYQNNAILGGYDFVARSDNFYSGHPHGTMVLATMGALSENEIVGTAPGASYYLFITEDNASETPLEESLWVEAAEHADSLGVDIINTSLGYVNFDNPAHNYSFSDMDGQTTFISRGAEIAASRGMLVVVSAGNSGATSQPFISAPADAQSVLTIGAVTASGNYASFSSIGPTADNRIKPDVVSQGQGAAIVQAPGALGFANGTSFSGPIIAGMAACLWQSRPELSVAGLRELIRASSDQSDNPNMYRGYGVPNFWLAYSTPLSTSVPETEKLRFSPTPSGDFIVFSGLDSNFPSAMRVVDMIGQTVLETLVINGESVDVSRLSAGMYTIVLRNKHGHRTAKMLKK